MDYKIFPVQCIIFMIFMVSCGGTKGGSSHEQVTFEIPDVWKEKAKTGVDFLALGNEPSWSAELDENGSLKLMVLFSDTIVTPTPEPLQDGANLIFKTMTSGDEIQLTISKEECSDTMSDRTYLYSAVLLLNDKQYKGCGVYLSEDRNVSRPNEK